MDESKPTLKSLLLRRKDYLTEHYGEFGARVFPATHTHDNVTALLAVLEQQGTGDTYDPNGELREQLVKVRDRIEDDLQGAIKDEFDD